MCYLFILQENFFSPNIGFSEKHPWEQWAVFTWMWFFFFFCASKTCHLGQDLNPQSQGQKIHPFVCAGSGVTVLVYVGLYTLCFVIKGSWRHVDGVTFWSRSIRSSPPVRGADLCEGNQTVLHPSLTLTLTPVWCHWSSFFFFLFSLLPCLSLLWLLPPSEFVSLSLIDLQIYSLENQDHFLGGWMLLSSSRCHFSFCDSVFFSLLFLTSSWIFSLEHAQCCTSWSPGWVGWCGAAAVTADFTVLTVRCTSKEDRIDLTKKTTREEEGQSCDWLWATV